MEQTYRERSPIGTFWQKAIICLAAIGIVSGGLWFVQARWMWGDPEKIKVDPRIETRINSLLEEAKEAGLFERMAICNEIRGMGREQLPVLVRALRNEDPAIRAFSTNVLQYCDNASVIPPIEERLNDESPIVRRAALLALGHLGSSGSAPVIVLSLEDEDKFTRCQAALVLGQVGGDIAVLPLVEMLENDASSVARRTAANSLGEIGNEGAVPPLINSLHDQDHHVRTASLVALNRITGAGLGPREEDWVSWWSQENGHTD